MFDRISKPLIIFQIILIIYLAWLIIKEKKENYPLKKYYKNYQSLVESLKKENYELKKRLEYLNNPENLKKELKEKFNLTTPDEKMIILPENF
ncbi:MAG: hypothetical protein KatS3mg095_0085 [Candidatus Parcubacteria bacterium]|nr:MAG: hypothetical protein KatS3mg095_0085 [Candidatus Parcubacteria bacterium]